MRPVVKQLIRKNYPVRSIDLDADSENLHTRYKVEAVPTFIVIDSGGQVLGRTSGMISAGDLVRFYQTAAAKAAPPANSNAHAATSEDDEDDANDPPKFRRVRESKEPRAPREAAPKRAPREADADPESDADADAATQGEFTNPNPWESSVRIKVIGSHSTGFGSGTIIHSTPDESLILTCAHIFHLEGQKQVSPANFPRKIVIDMFDGELEVQPKQAGRVRYKESFEGKAVDYDFSRDVGLIRIRPGRQLPASRVVPRHWEPESRMRMLTVGCSEGQDATAWHTQIIKPRVQNFLKGRPSYEAIECWKAPKQGRSGGGLFTDNGYIAGVCDFAEPQGDHGLYATPRSIYHLLDRNNLMALYAPPAPGMGTMVADNRPARARDASGSAPLARSQSPDREESPRSRDHQTADDDATLPPPPPPTFLGIVVPHEPGGSKTRAAAITRRTNWQPIHTADDTDQPEDVESEANHDRHADKTVSSRDPDRSSTALDPAGAGSASKRWRAVKPAPANPLDSPTP
jgi:hypothetical protein